MVNFTEKYKNLIEEVERTLIELIKDKGERSKHYNEKALIITDDDKMFNIAGGRWLTEITTLDNQTLLLIDNYGYQYSVTVLDDMENLFIVADYLQKKY